MVAFSPPFDSHQEHPQMQAWERFRDIRHRGKVVLSLSLSLSLSPCIPLSGEKPKNIFFSRFEPSKFEAIFSKYAKTIPDALSESELNTMLKANRNVYDFFGWWTSSACWGVIQLFFTRGWLDCFSVGSLAPQSGGFCTVWGRMRKDFCTGKR